jgi:hypothetical protein
MSVISRPSRRLRCVQQALVQRRRRAKTSVGGFGRVLRLQVLLISAGVDRRAVCRLGGQAHDPVVAFTCGPLSRTATRHRVIGLV